MTGFNVVQILLGAAVAVVVVLRMRALAYRADLDGPAFTRAVRAALEDGDGAAARAIAEAARPGFVAELTLAALDASAAGEPVPGAIEEREADLQFEAARGLRGLRVLASVGTATGFLGALLEVIWLYQGDHGLLALKAGAAEQVALGRAVLTMSLGVAIAVFALGSRGVLLGISKRLREDLRTCARMLDQVFETRAIPKG